MRYRRFLTCQQGENGANLKRDMEEDAFSGVYFPGSLVIQLSESLKFQHLFLGDSLLWKRWFR